jgi:hypothetical protein
MGEEDFEKTVSATKEEKAGANVRSPFFHVLGERGNR